MKKLNFYWILLFLAPLPLLSLLFYYSSRVEKLCELSEKIEILHEKKRHADQIKKRQHSFTATLLQADSQYIDKHLETLTFLESEVKKLETQNDELATKRLAFLKEGANRLILVEEKRRTKDKLCETQERLQHPVEIHEEDLKKLLCLIEGVTIWPYGPKEGKPQLLFQDFRLTRKQQSPSGAVFSLNFNMIKRENLSP
jgi:hypothetical protein